MNIFPDLSNETMISVDTETYDPELLTMGPGAMRKDGFVVGFSLATPGGFSNYYPLRHSEGNLQNPEQAINYLRDTMRLPVPKVGANIMYDMSWMYGDFGIEAKGKKLDIQVIEPLIDENRESYSLKSLCEAYLGSSKAEDGLLRASVEILGYKPTKDASELVKHAKQAMHRIPARYVTEYGAEDAVLPLRILEKQMEEIKKQKLERVFDMETRLIDMLFAMWKRGIRVDEEYANIAANELEGMYSAEMGHILRHTGMTPDIWSSDHLAELCEKIGAAYPLTAKGNPSFTAEFLDLSKNEVLKHVLNARQLDRSGSVYIRSKILKHCVNGRIHPQFFSVKNERGGTVSGRLSSQNPNAQQFPARNKFLAKKVRDCILPEKGKKFGVFDFSQQEPRIIIHYASVCGMPGVDRAVRQFCENPATDYHGMVRDMIWPDNPDPDLRKLAKTINLGLAYNMGEKKMAEKLGMDLSEAKKVFQEYHRGLPYLKALNNFVKNVAKHRGYITTLGGRKRHFDLFGPLQYTDGLKPLKFEAAVAKWGNSLNRYFVHKTMNALIQGGGADMVKQSMLDCYEAGFLPCMTIHDELDFPEIESEEQCNIIKGIMEKSVLLEVPNKVDVEVGDRWGSCKENYFKNN